MRLVPSQSLHCSLFGGSGSLACVAGVAGVADSLLAVAQGQTPLRPVGAGKVDRARNGYRLDTGIVDARQPSVSVNVNLASEIISLSGRTESHVLKETKCVREVQVAAPYRTLQATVQRDNLKRTLRYTVLGNPAPRVPALSPPFKLFIQAVRHGVCACCVDCRRSLCVPHPPPPACVFVDQRRARERACSDDNGIAAAHVAGERVWRHRLHSLLGTAELERC